MVGSLGAIVREQGLLEASLGFINLAKWTLLSLHRLLV